MSTLCWSKIYQEGRVHGVPKNLHQNIRGTITILDLYTHPGSECQENLSLEMLNSGATKIWSNFIQG